MRRTATALVAVLALAGCGGTVQPTDATTSSVSATEASPPATGPTETTSQVAPTSSATGGEAALGWVQTSYAGASWLPAIVSTYDQAGGLWADTTLAPDATVEAEAICSALSAYVLMVAGEFRPVTVRAVDGQQLVLRLSIAETCATAA